MLFPMFLDNVFDYPVNYHRKRDPILEFFDDAPAMKLRRPENPPKQILDEENFVVRVDCRGYSPKELKIDVDNDFLVVEGHMMAGDISTPSGTLERDFKRKIQIPENVNRETLKSDFKDGKLIIIAEKKIPELKKTSIPINIIKKDAPPTPAKSDEASKQSSENSTPRKSDPTLGSPGNSSESTKNTCVNCECEKKTKLAPSDNPEVVVEVEE